MKKYLLGVLMLVVCCLVVPAYTGAVEEQKYELKSAAMVKDVLIESIGKKVIVRMDTGDSLEGTVTKVGDNLVHLTRIVGRDFYDAVVRMDKISAVLFKVRTN